MQLAEIINALSILIFIGYWIINAKSVKQTREKVGGIGSYGHYILIAVAATVMNIKVYPLTIQLFPFLNYIGILSIICSVLGLILTLMARRTLAKNWSSSVTFKKDHELITWGVYKYMRHPIYTGILLMLIGTILAIETVGVVAGFIIIFIAFWLKLKQEENLLTKHFSKEYPAYKNKVKALVPFIL